MADQDSPPEGRAPNPPSRRNLLLLTAGAAIVGVLVVFGAVLPAEYNMDPLGLGKATGLSRLWAPAEVQVAATAGNQPLAREYPTPFRSDVIEIPLTTGDDTGAGTNELEYKVRVKQGGSYVYTWTVAGLTNPEEFYYDFHGHTVVPEGSKQEMTVSTYKQATGLAANGSLVAPFDGIHGWYFQNQGVPAIKVTLRIAGFYELIPAGQEGNLAGIAPRGQAAPAP